MSLMRPSLLLAILPLLIAPAYACDPGKGEAPLFTCETRTPGEVISICAVEAQDGTWSKVQYRFGPAEKPSFIYPADGLEGAKTMFFSHVKKSGAYIVTVRFVSEGITYRLYSKAVSEMEGEAGVIVENTSRPSMNKISCGERPYMFAGYLRDALACDLENPLGAKACEENPPEEP
jgi:hypothetical protein